MLKFGARVVAPVEVEALIPAKSPDESHALKLDCGALIHSRVILLALGVRWRQLEATGAYVHIPRADRDYAIDVGLRMLTLRHLVTEEAGSYRANPKELLLLRYYANAIAHLFAKAPPAEVVVWPASAQAAG